jgi:predicted oxidoreductase
MSTLVDLSFPETIGKRKEQHIQQPAGTRKKHIQNGQSVTAQILINKKARRILGDRKS